MRHVAVVLREVGYVIVCVVVVGIAVLLPNVLGIAHRQLLTLVARQLD